MKTNRFILVAVMVMSSITFCQAQEEKKVTDKAFLTFLEKFKTVNPPTNYKTIQHLSVDMTDEEAMKFLHKKEADIYCVLKELGEDDKWYEIIEKNIPGCKFKYTLNDSVYVLCILESMLGVNYSTTLAFLYSFTHNGKIIDKNLVGQEYANENTWVSFVLLDKRHIRVFYYEDNNTREKEGYRSIVHYVNYEIAGDGKFIEKDKSGITWLKDWATLYSDYDPKSDDPMNEYNF